MKFSGKMGLMMILKVRKKQRFIHQLKNNFGKSHKSDQIDPPSQIFLGLTW